VRLPVTIPGQRVRLGLADLRRGRLERALPADGYPDDGITLRHIIRDGERDVAFSYTDAREPQGGGLLLHPCAAGERRHGLVESGLGRRLSFALRMAGRFLKGETP
jgi:hypothetical protein